MNEPMDRGHFLRHGLLGTLIAPKKAIGLKRDVTEVRSGDTLTADRLNEIIREVNNR